MHANKTTLTNVIDCAYHISGLSNADAHAALVDLLASHPTIILNHFNFNRPSIPKSKPSDVPPRYKVVVAGRPSAKINFIKLARELHGTGLASSKDWSEGKSFHEDFAKNIPFGIMGEELTEEQAINLQRKCCASGAGCAFSIQKQQTEYNGCVYACP